MTTLSSTVIDTALRRALLLAARGPIGGVNPRVGCVILSPEGQTLAEGWHRGAGTAHAEVDALDQLAAGTLRGTTAVVTLEPCNHTGRTGPCTEALIAAGITQVVYSVSDPGAQSGGGAATLRAAGVAVEGGRLAAEGEAFLHRWLVASRLGRPFVSLKWASSLDGRTAAADGTSQWITGSAARQRVHEQRAASDAILVGTGTVLADDPSLTARGDGGELLPQQPLPVVIGERAIPVGARLNFHPRGVRQTGSRDLAAVLAELFADGIRSVFVEGGATLANAFVAADLVDEYLIYLAPSLIGGATAQHLAVGNIGVNTLAAARRLQFDSVVSLGTDLLLTARPVRAAEPPPAPTLTTRTTPTAATNDERTAHVHRDH